MNNPSFVAKSNVIAHHVFNSPFLYFALYFLIILLRLMGESGRWMRAKKKKPSETKIHNFILIRIALLKYAQLKTEVYVPKINWFPFKIRAGFFSFFYFNFLSMLLLLFVERLNKFQIKHRENKRSKSALDKLNRFLKR